MRVYEGKGRNCQALLEAEELTPPAPLPPAGVRIVATEAMQVSENNPLRQLDE